MIFTAAISWCVQARRTLTPPSLRTAVSTLSALTALCASPLSQAQPGSPPRTDELSVVGARLPYIDEGRGPAIVLLHDQLSDHRSWDTHRTALAQRGFRVVAYSLRYYGPEMWRDEETEFSVPTHVRDLVELIERLHAGPVHLVGRDYGASVALATALQHPALVRSAFLFEGGLPGSVADPAVRGQIDRDAAALSSRSRQALAEGRVMRAATELIDDMVERRGHFNSLPPESQRIAIENARTLPMFFAQAPATAVTCQALARNKVPLAIVSGEKSRPAFRLTDEATARCAGAARRIVLAGQDHLWPAGDAESFVRQVSDFVSGARTAEALQTTRPVP